MCSQLFEVGVSCLEGGQGPGGVAARLPNESPYEMRLVGQVRGGRAGEARKRRIARLLSAAVVARLKLESREQ